MSQSLEYIDQAIQEDLEVALAEFQKEQGEIPFHDDLIVFMTQYFKNLNEFQRKRLSHMDNVIEGYKQKILAARELVSKKEESIIQYSETTKALTDLFEL